MTEACRFRSENYAPRRDHGSSHASFSPNTTREPRPPSRDTENAKHFTYYGPTTQPHIHSPSNDLITNGAEDDIAPNIPLNMDSIPLRKALIELFFKLQTRFITLVNEQLFMTDWALQKRSQYYSSFLEDAILAFSARHSTSSAMRKLRDKYTTRCKSKIIMELEDPNIAYLQGLLLLGDCETTRGRPRTGWTYCSK